MRCVTLPLSRFIDASRRRNRLVFRCGRSASTHRNISATILGNDADFFQLAIDQLRRQTTGFDLESLQAAVACCHTQQNLSDLLETVNGRNSLSSLESRLLLLACARHGALHHASDIVAKTLSAGCSDSDSRVLLNGLLRMSTNTNQLASVMGLTSPSSRDGTALAAGSDESFAGMLWAAIEADDGALAAHIVGEWHCKTKAVHNTTSSAQEWLESTVVRPAEDVALALSLQKRAITPTERPALVLLRGLLPQRGAHGISGALLARVKAGAHPVLGPTGLPRHAALCALAQLSEASMLDIASTRPPTRRAYTVRILAPAHAKSLLRSSHMSSRSSLFRRHVDYLTRLLGAVPSPADMCQDSSLALVTADTANGSCSPADAIDMLRARSTPVSVKQGCSILVALLEAPHGAIGDATIHCCEAFHLIVRSRPNAFASDAEIGLLLIAVASEIVPILQPNEIHSSISTAVRVAVRSCAAVTPTDFSPVRASTRDHLKACAATPLGSSVGDVSLWLLQQQLQRQDRPASSSTSAWWLSPLVSRFPPLYDASLEPPSYLRELSPDDSSEGGGAKSSVDWFDDIGHAAPGSADVDTVMLLRDRLRMGGAFLTGYFAEAVDALALRPDNIFGLLEEPLNASCSSGPLAAWVAGGPSAVAVLQVRVVHMACTTVK